jgi:protein-L-isoaspartate O-methyltransferase
MSTSPAWDARKRDLSRKAAEDELVVRDKNRDKKSESKSERRRPTFVVRNTQLGLGISSFKDGSHLHTLIDKKDGLFVASGAKGRTVEDLLVNLNYLDAPKAESVTGTTVAEKVEAVASTAARAAKSIGKGAHNAITVVQGATDLLEAIAIASPILKAVFGVVATVAKMHVQVQVNKEKARVLIALVESFQVPLGEVEKLLTAQTLDLPFAEHLQLRLTALKDAMERAELVLKEWCAQAGRSLLKVIKRHLAAGDINKAFDESKDALRQHHQLLCNDLAIKVAAKVLGESSGAAEKAVAQAGSACKSDLANLETDLGSAFKAVGKSLSDELKLMDWSLDGLHTSVAQMSEKQDKMLALQEDTLALQKQMQEEMQRLVELVKKSKAPAAESAIKFEPAQAFWFDVIEPKLMTAGEVPWSLFASAVFVELLEPGGVSAVDWNGIKPQIKKTFDRDDDGQVSVFEYDAVTSKKQMTMLEICQELLGLKGKPSSSRGDIRYPPLANEERVMVQAIFGTDPKQDEALVFALSSVPRAWFAVDVSGKAAPLADVCAPERHWVAGALRMPSARLCVDLLRWLGFGCGGVGDNASFLHVACGNAYVNALVAVVQQWQYANVAAAEGNDGALANAVARVAAFAKAAHVVAPGVKPLSTFTTSDTFDRVLVSLLCASADAAREQFGALLAPDGRLVVPVQAGDDVVFVRVSAAGGPVEELRRVAGAQAGELRILFPRAPPAPPASNPDYGVMVAQAKK